MELKSLTEFIMISAGNKRDRVRRDILNIMYLSGSFRNCSGRYSIQVAAYHSCRQVENGLYAGYALGPNEQSAITVECYLCGRSVSPNSVNGCPTAVSASRVL